MLYPQGGPKTELAPERPPAAVSSRAVPSGQAGAHPPHISDCLLLPGPPTATSIPREGAQLSLGSETDLTHAPYWLRAVSLLPGALPLSLGAGWGSTLQMGRPEGRKVPSASLSFSLWVKTEAQSDW